MLSNSPYLFSRTLNTEDKVLVGLDLVSGLKKIDVQGLWPDATHLHDYYSGQQVTVEDGHVNLNSTNSVVLLGQPH